MGKKWEEGDVASFLFAFPACLCLESETNITKRLNRSNSAPARVDGPTKYRTPQVCWSHCLAWGRQHRVYVVGGRHTVGTDGCQGRLRFLRRGRERTLDESVAGCWSQRRAPALGRRRRSRDAASPAVQPLDLAVRRDCSTGARQSRRRRRDVGGRCGCLERQRTYSRTERRPTDHQPWRRHFTHTPMPVLQLGSNVLAKTFYLSCNTGITASNRHTWSRFTRATGNVVFNWL